MTSLLRLRSWATKPGPPSIVNWIMELKIGGWIGRGVFWGRDAGYPKIDKIWQNHKWLLGWIPWCWQGSYGVTIHARISHGFPYPSILCGKHQVPPGQVQVTSTGEYRRYLGKWIWLEKHVSTTTSHWLPVVLRKKTAAWWWIEDLFLSNKALITWENLQLHLIPMNHMVEQVGRRSHPMNSWWVPWLVPMGPMARRSWSFHNRRVSKNSWWVNPDHSIVVHRFSRNVWV